eukprot:TRINITY_DN5975_c0_g1_i2.p1 TRINITY_DN5975_c0_g1~~TRINITY_DN5975_c0_g1_i2.p1  ORF type:complete len:404 (+),score=76.28 TRINITY_DN5975_c0_g1_i2:80-1291(+)
MPSQAAGLRKSRLSTAQSSTIVEGIKHCWLALPRERQQCALRFADAALVARAHQAQQTLYSSEMSCYNSGINLKFDEAGQPIVSTGLLHFQFEFAPEGPQAIVATPHLLDLPDFFGYMLARLGTLFPFGYPALRHKPLWSTFEPQPNSWTQFECQLLRLAEFSIFETFEAERKAMPRRGAPVACLRPPALEEVCQETNSELDWLTADAEEAASSRSSKRRARRRNDRPAGGASVAAAPAKPAACSSRELEVVAEDATQAAVAPSEDMGCIEDWTLVYKKARKPGTPQGSSACSTTSGHSRISSWMTEGTEVSKSLAEISEAMDEVVHEEDLVECQQTLEATTETKYSPVDSDRLARWVPVGRQGYVSEWLLADEQEESVRACIKQTFWDVEHVRPSRPRTKSW